MKRHTQETLRFPSIKPTGDGTSNRKAGKQGSSKDSGLRVTFGSNGGSAVEEAAPAKQQPKKQGSTITSRASVRREQLFEDEEEVKEQPARRASRTVDAALPAKASSATPAPATRTSSRQAAAAAAPATESRSSRSQVKQKPTPKKTTQASSTPMKAAKRTHAGGSKQGTGSSVQFFDSYEVHGEEYKAGDAVYVVRTQDQDQWPDDDAQDMCVMCSQGNKSHTILECDRCLGGFHMGCLRPPLKAVPKGVWVCDGCARGEDPGANRKLRTAYEKFLFPPKSQEVLALGVVTGFVKNRCGSGELEIKCQYFCRPQDTHMGRQPHNGSREVFLTTTEHFEPAEAIWGPATVCSAKEFEEEEGTDVYFCEYEYDEQWKRFRRSAYNRRASKAQDTAGHSSDESDQGDVSDSDDSDYDGRRERVCSDDEEYVRNRNYKPIYAFWAERGMLPPSGAGGMARGRGAPTRKGGALNRKQAGWVQPQGSEEQGGAQLLELSGGGGLSSQPAPSNPNALVAARKALATSAPPATLPCRDSEKATLTTFMRAAINEEGGCGPGVLYVCGVPGTGKTACINEVLGGLRPQAQAQGVQLVFLNALSLPSPTHVYCKLWEKLTGQHLGPARALAALEATFSAQGAGVGMSAGAASSSVVTATGARGGARGGASQGQSRRPCMTLLVVDEIDVLITKGQAVLYNLFEWPVRPGARLAVIGISNTHDLDDRVLPRISSRLASSKLAFNAYTAAQLTEITNQRLQAAGCGTLVKKEGVVWAVRKVASSSGDVRRALELLRRALEVAEAERREQGAPLIRPGDAASTGCVTEKHVQVAVKEMFTSPHMQFLRSCSRLEKLALVALLLEMRATSKPDASVQAIHDRLCSHVSLLIPDARVEAVTLCRVLFEMAAKRLLVTSPSWQALKARVALNVHKDDVCLAVREDMNMQAVHGQLA